MIANTLNRNLMIAIFLTLAALALHGHLPQKKQLIFPSTKYPAYIYAGNLPDGKTAGSWTNEAEHRWRCILPERSDDYFPCSLNVSLDNGKGKGLDFSSYKYLRVKLDFVGTADMVQLAIRNSNSAYTTASDPNSSKFMAINLLPKDLSHELAIDLDKFSVAHWWQAQYRLPLSLVQAEMNNVTSISIDVQGAKKVVGEQHAGLIKMELVGDWVDAKNWYLGILLLWLSGISIWVLFEFINLRRKNLKDIAAISELADSNQQLKNETDKFRRLSTIDPLTQTFNRFGVDQIVRDLLNSLVNNELNSPVLALILMDIDHFKRINDTRGHDVGDLVLQKISQVICNNVRAQDYVGRWGGEEFLVILPQTSEQQALTMAEKLREVIAAISFELEKPLPVTASFGVTEFLNTDDFATCFKRADTALYSAKACGRNCCILAG